MLTNKLTELKNNSLFASLKNSILTNKYLDLSLLFLSFVLVSTFGLCDILGFTLMSLSIKVLLGLEKLTDTNKINYLLNLVKFWCVSFLLIATVNFVNGFVGNNFIMVILELFLTYFIVTKTSSWFNENNMVLENTSEKLNLSGSIDFVDYLLTNLSDLYRFNYVSFNSLFNVIIALLNKFNLIEKYMNKPKDNLEKSDNKSDDKPDDKPDRILEKILDETFVKKDHLDSLDDDDFTMVSNKKLD